MMTDYDISIDQYLQELALTAQGHPAKSPQRRLALSKLIKALKQSGKLTRPKSGSFVGMYNSIYDEALQRLFVFICDRIDAYDPTKGEVLQWVNFLLGRRFFNEASREIWPTLPKGVNAQEVTRLSIEELDRHNPSDLNPNLIPSTGEELREYIEEDAQQLLRSVHVAKHPEVTLHRIVLKRLNGFSWQELSAETGVAVPTLSSFYQRSIKKIKDQLKGYLS